MEATSQTKMDYIEPLEAQLEKNRKELSEMEEQLNKSRNMLQAILQTINEIVIVFDKDLNIKMINRQVNFRDKNVMNFFSGYRGFVKIVQCCERFRRKGGLPLRKLSGTNIIASKPIPSRTYRGRSRE